MFLSCTSYPLLHVILRTLTLEFRQVRVSVWRERERHIRCVLHFSDPKVVFKQELYLFFHFQFCLSLFLLNKRKLSLFLLQLQLQSVVLQHEGVELFL